MKTFAPEVTGVTAHAKVSPRKGPYLLYRRFGPCLCVAHCLRFLFGSTRLPLVYFNVEVQMCVSEERVISSRTGGSDCAFLITFDGNLFLLPIQ